MKVLQAYTSSSKIIGLAFTSFAIIFLIIGVGILADNYNRLKKYMQTTGTVIGAVKYNTRKGKIVYSRVIRYSDETGKDYELVESSYSSIKPKVGKKIKVAYNPEDPGEAISLSFSDFFLGPIIVFVFVAIFLPIGIFQMIQHFKDKARKIDLIKKGNIIYADLVKVELDYRTSVNDRHPYVIYAKAKIGRKEIEFESDPVWFDPEVVFSDGKVPVFIDPADPLNYYVDIRKGMELKPKP